MTRRYLSEVKDMEEFARFLHFCKIHIDRGEEVGAIWAAWEQQKSGKN